MKLPGIAIKNFQFTLIIIFLLIIFGFASFINMPRSENPPVGKPGTSIIILYPGATPKDMEQLVTAPIEEVLNELDDIKKIDSRSEDSLSLIQIEFLSGSDPDKKYSDVNEKINTVREKLPDGILDLKTIKWTIEDTNFLQMAIVSEKEEYRELESRADLLKKNLEKTRGVRRVKTWAFPKQEASISLDLEKIASLGIPVTRIVKIITGNNTNIPGGNIDLGIKKFNIESSGPFRSIDEISNTVINSDGQNILFLKDVASVKMSYAEHEHIARFDGKKSVFVTANQKIGTNIFSVMGAVREKIENFKDGLPEGVSIHYIFDQSIGVDEKLSGFFLNLLQGILLVGIVILLVLGFRGSLIVILVIPISIFIAIGFVDLSGYGIEQMSIAGLVITLGLLVDNAIVVTENISRFIKKGYSRTEAAVKGSSEIGWPIITATLTTILAFVPIIMMQDVSGDFIRSMPVTVIYTLGASLFIALTFTPYLSSRFLRIEKKESRIYIILNKFINGRYGKLLKQALDNPKKVLSIALVTFILSLSLFPLIGVTFFPKADKHEFIINISTPEGTNLETTDSYVKKIETILNKTKGVKHFTSNTGNSNPVIYYNMIEKQGKSNIAQMYVELKKISRKEMFSLLDGLREKVKSLAGVKVEVKEFEQGPPVEAPVEIKILGKKLEIIKKIAVDIEKIFMETAGLININNPLATTKTDIRIVIDRKRAGMSGVLLSDADIMIRLAVEGLKVSSFRNEEGKEFDIVFYGDRKTGKDQGIKIFDRIFIDSLSGAQIPLSQIASTELMASPTVVSRYNLERSVSITADVSRGYSVNDVTTNIEEKLKKYQWPPGYNFYVGGEKESQAESFGGMGKAVIVAIIAIFAVLVLQFGSFAQPLIIFAALPFAIIGSIIFLLITGFTFSFTAFVGLTSLVGIVINNSIILVDYTNKLITGGLEKVEALIKASKTRFTPIILTTFTTIGGLLPLTLGGGELWGPMGWTIIGGLLVSTILTLIIVPVLYKLFTKQEIRN